jgi:catechol 2,3-dioxygenase-like lactoylglutathione lyase family enzyme
VIPVREIDHLVLRARDLPAMVKFYMTVFGCHVEKRQDALGLVQLRMGNSLLDILAADGELGRVGGAPPGAGGFNLDHFCFRVAPFDEGEIKAHLAACGVSAGATEHRYGAEGQGPSIYITDPEGNTVELKGPPDVSATA